MSQVELPILSGPAGPIDETCPVWADCHLWMDPTRPQGSLCRRGDHEPSEWPPPNGWGWPPDHEAGVASTAAAAKTNGTGRCHIRRRGGAATATGVGGVALDDAASGVGTAPLGDDVSVTASIMQFGQKSPGPSDGSVAPH